jgi:ankyrin repeat protein
MNYILSLLIVLSASYSISAMEQEKANVGLMLFRAKNMLLTQAASQGNAARVDALLALPGIQVDYKDGEGRTALHYAALLDKADMARKLLAHGADRSITDKSGKTPYMVATTSELQDLLKV